jgi:hypothetical protein
VEGSAHDDLFVSDACRVRNDSDEKSGEACIRRVTPALSLRATRSAEPKMHVACVALATAKLADAISVGDRKSADADFALVAAKDVDAATSELWKHSRRDFTTRFQWRTARLVFEDVDSTRKSLW